MQKLIIYFMLFAGVLSCKKEVKNVTEENSSSEFVSFQNTATTQTLDTEAEKILNTWKEYQELQNSFELMYRAANNEDLVLAIDDLLEKEKAISKSDYPERFNKPQVKSRQKVLRTFLLKVKASLADKTNTDTAIKQMVEARNAYRNQFNVIISNTLDDTLILDEN